VVGTKRSKDGQLKSREMPNTTLKGQTKRGLYWKFVDQTVTYGMQFIMGIVMALLLSPDDYGITALTGVFKAVGVFCRV